MDNVNEVKLFKLDLVKGEDFDLLNVGFNPAFIATNSEIVQYVNQAKKDLFTGGRILKINGACSLVVLANLMPDLVYYYSVVAIFDPKLDGYVVSHSESPDFKVGQLLK